jgi:hypothetical protein
MTPDNVMTAHKLLAQRQRLHYAIKVLHPAIEGEAATPAPSFKNIGGLDLYFHGTEGVSLTQIQTKLGLPRDKIDGVVRIALLSLAYEELKQVEERLISLGVELDDA